MSVRSVIRMYKEIHQLQSHKGQYYDNWLNHYKQSLGHCRRIAKTKGLPKRWCQGMEEATKRLEKERYDNT